MEFIKILEELKRTYGNDRLVRKNGTVLLGPGKMPLYQHMLFKPLASIYIKVFLVAPYKNKFPAQYIKLLRYSNGANLYNVKVNGPGVTFAHSLLIIFGLPLTDPFKRKLDREEPFDIRIEDLARHDDIPHTWLKCGTYTRDGNLNVTNDIFIDTVSNRVFSVEKNEKEIIESWESLDECLCSIYKSLMNSDKEYDFK